MKLYTFELAPNPRRVALMLRYKGVELDTEEVNLAEGEQFSDSFKAINDRCTVPALVLDDGTVLTDVVAICLYLESVYPERPLFGQNGLEQAQIVGWTHRIFLEGLKSVAEMLRNRGGNFENRALPGPLEVAQIPELIERGRMCLHAFWNDMDRHLKDRQYLATDSLSQADIDGFVLCDFAGWVKESIPADCTHLQAWYQRVKVDLGLE